MFTEYKDFSYLGLGIMRHDPHNFTLTQQLIDMAMTNGVNYFESCYFYLDNQCEQILAKALSKYDRNSYKLCAKMPVKGILESIKNPQQIFEEQKKHLNTDYFDVYLLQALDRYSLKILLETNVISFLLEQKEKGIIKELGFSFHDSPEWLEKILQLKCWDVVQIQLNYYDWYFLHGKENYEIISKYNLPIIVMGPTKGGFLINHVPLNLQKNIEIKFLPYIFLWQLKNVKCILTGANNLTQLKENINFINKLPVSTFDNFEQTINDVIYYLSHQNLINCTGCNYCQPCPAGIKIPYYFNEYNKIISQGNKYYNLHSYLNTVHQSQPINKCINCQRCEKMCPQHLPIRYYLANHIFTLRY